MKQRAKYAVIILLSVALAVSLSMHYVDPRERSIRGTFISGHQTSPEAVYLVFEQGGSSGDFIMYRQFEVLEYGHFASTENNIYSLDGVDNSWEIIFVGDVVYFICQSGEVAVFTRLSLMPNFINVFRPDF